MEKGNTALLVIDAQIGPLWETYKKEETLSVIQTVIAKAKSKGIPTFYIQYEDDALLAKGSQFWQLDPSISLAEGDRVIHKRFADSFEQTSLKEELERKGITDLVIVGVRTEFCIAATCQTASTLGFHVILIENGHTTVDGEIPAERVINQYNEALGKIGSADRTLSIVPASEVHFS